MTSISKYRYVLRENKTDTAEAAPYVAAFESNGTIDEDGLIDLMREMGCRADVETIRLVFRAKEAVIRSKANGICRFADGALTYMPMISGSFGSIDAEFDPAVNSVYLGVHLTDDIRLSLDGVIPKLDKDASDVAELAISVVFTPELGTDGYNVLKFPNAFRIVGKGFVLSNPETDKVTIADKTAEEHVVTASTDSSRHLECSMPTGIPAGNATITVCTAGGVPSGSVRTITRKVKVVANPTPPGPTPIAQSEDGLVKVFTQGDKENPVDGELHLDGEFRWKVTGEGFSGTARSVSDVKVIDPQGESLGLMGWDMSDDGKTLEIYNGEDPIVLTPGRHEGYKIGLVTMDQEGNEEVVALPAVALVVGENA